MIHSQLSNSMLEASVCAWSAVSVMVLRNISSCSLSSTACSEVSSDAMALIWSVEKVAVVSA